jgi:superfamily II DNA helicase RecQ
MLSSHGAGAGKSLCYQLAAVVGGGTVLVVSPLLALMRDQLAHLPPGLPAAMLSASQPRGEARQVLDDLKARRFSIASFCHGGWDCRRQTTACSRVSQTL